MKKTKAKIYLESLSIELAEGLTMAFDTFGADVLKREFKFSHDSFPIDLEDHLIKWNRIDLESYDRAVKRLFEQAYAKNEPLFLGVTTDCALMYNGLFGTVLASSFQFRKTEEEEIISPDYGSVIISSNIIPDQGKKGRIKAGLYGMHELGHLFTGLDACKEQNCIYSHPTSPRAAFENNTVAVLRGGKIPVCDRDQKRIVDFQKKWEIK